MPTCIILIPPETEDNYLRRHLQADVSACKRLQLAPVHTSPLLTLSHLSSCPGLCSLSFSPPSSVLPYLVGLFLAGSSGTRVATRTPSTLPSPLVARRRLLQPFDDWLAGLRFPTLPGEPHGRSDIWSANLSSSSAQILFRGKGKAHCDVPEFIAGSTIEQHQYMLLPHVNSTRLVDYSIYLVRMLFQHSLTRRSEVSRVT